MSQSSRRAVGRLWLMFAALSSCCQTTLAINWISSPGGCRIDGGNLGSFSELWGLSQVECANECAPSAACTGLEFLSGKITRCRLYHELLVHALPAEHGATCQFKETPEARAAWKGKSGGASVGGAGSGSQLGRGTQDACPAEPCLQTICKARKKSAGGLLDLQKADLSGCYLGYVDLTGAIMTEANLAGATLEWAKLGGAQLVKVNLEGAMMKNADLSGANLEHARLVNADMTEAILAGVSCVLCEMDGSLMAKVNLAGARFFEASINGAQMMEVNLQDATFERTSIMNVEFTQAKLQGVQFTMSDVMGSSFKDAKFDSSTTFDELTKNLEQTTFLPQEYLPPPP